MFMMIKISFAELKERGVVLERGRLFGLIVQDGRLN
jgi:hypothetical protein